MEGVRRPTALQAGAVALLALLVAFLCPAAPARAAALPPDLVALEQQMAQLQANSERFSFQEEVSLGGLFGQGVPFILLIAGDGEASDSPPEATAVGGLLGLPEVQTRLIGDTAYSYRSTAGEIDGGRPWVSSPRKEGKEGSGLDPGGILDNDQAGRQGTFSKLIEELNGALSLEESGPATVDGQRVIEFNATLNPAPFLEQLKSQSKQPEHPLNSLLETSPVSGPKAPAKPAPPPKLELEVFIAPNGLPVRARFTFSAEGATIAVRVDTLAINIPVHVTPPPPKQTITEAQLKQIERRRAARELKLALRACRHLHGKAATRCRLIAHAKSRVPSSEAVTL
ncbi:MAG: hypothetical protein ACLP1Q_17420 [Solirubrobacteraceae bacterium]